VISVNDALRENNIAPWATLYGYVEIQYTWAWDAICVMVRSVDTAHSLIYSSGLRPSALATSQHATNVSSSQLVEGMWWKHEANVSSFIALSNTTFAGLRASVQITDSKNNPIASHTVTISPHGTFNGTFNLELHAEENSGALLLASGSVDQTNTYVFEVMPRTAVPDFGKSLSRWSTANGDDTMITIWNPADEAQVFIFTLFYAGGHYRLPVHLLPRATRAFNVSEVIEAHVPDDEGNVIPDSVHEGSGKVEGSLGPGQLITVITDANVFNVVKATCVPICIQCGGPVSGYITANPFAVAVRGQTQLTLTLENGSGTKTDFTASAPWKSSNTSVATVSKGLTTGATAGDVVIVVDGLEEPSLAQSCGDPAGGMLFRTNRRSTRAGHGTGADQPDGTECLGAVDGHGREQWLHSLQQLRHRGRYQISGAGSKLLSH
jgi:hypothetical protein